MDKRSVHMAHSSLSMGANQAVQAPRPHAFAQQTAVARQLHQYALGYQVPTQVPRPVMGGHVPNHGHIRENSNRYVAAPAANEDHMAAVIKYIPSDFLEDDFKVLMAALRMPLIAAFNYLYDKYNGGSFNGTAFVNFHTMEDARIFIAAMHRYPLHSNWLDVRYKRIPQYSRSKAPPSHRDPQAISYRTPTANLNASTTSNHGLDSHTNPTAVLSNPNYQPTAAPPAGTQFDPYFDYRRTSQYTSSNTIGLPSSSSNTNTNGSATTSTSPPPASPRRSPPRLKLIIPAPEAPQEPVDWLDAFLDGLWRPRLHVNTTPPAGCGHISCIGMKEGAYRDYICDVSAGKWTNKSTGARGWVI